MKKLSTQCMDELKDKTDKNRNEKKQSTPRTQTLDFLMQFARVYHSEPTLHPELCGVVMN